MASGGQIQIHALGAHTPTAQPTAISQFSCFFDQFFARIGPLQNAIYLGPLVIWQTTGTLPALRKKEGRGGSTIVSKRKRGKMREKQNTFSPFILFLFYLTTCIRVCL